MAGQSLLVHGALLGLMALHASAFFLRPLLPPLGLFPGAFPAYRPFFQPAPMQQWKERLPTPNPLGRKLLLERLERDRNQRNQLQIVPLDDDNFLAINQNFQASNRDLNSLSGASNWVMLNNDLQNDLNDNNLLAISQPDLSNSASLNDVNGNNQAGNFIITDEQGLF
ncbi:hypothetical protein ACOMHN_063103 [Nucella lapillus]